MTIEENVPLAPFTTFGIGGVGRFFVRIGSVEELTVAINFAKEKALKMLLLGGGSNMLVPDSGWDGMVLKIEINGVELQDATIAESGEEDAKATCVLIAGAGESWDKVVERAVLEELWGIENLSGVPGTVGGAVVQNIGAYGAALSQTLSWVEVYNITTGEVTTMSNADCAFGYRESFFKSHEGEHVVLRAAFALFKNPHINVEYKDLAKLFNDSSIDLHAVRDAVLQIRKNKFPDLSVEGTAGSFFKNPIVSNEQAQVLIAQYPGMPVFSMPETSGVKIPLAWLLDNVLNAKGLSVGGARLYEKQPLVIVAKKNSAATDVHALAQKIKNEVKNKLDLVIEEEVTLI